MPPPAGLQSSQQQQAASQVPSSMPQAPHLQAQVPPPGPGGGLTGSSSSYLVSSVNAGGPGGHHHHQAAAAVSGGGVPYSAISGTISGTMNHASANTGVVAGHVPGIPGAPGAHHATHPTGGNGPGGAAVPMNPGGSAQVQNVMTNVSAMPPQGAQGLSSMPGAAGPPMMATGGGGATVQATQPYGATQQPPGVGAQFAARPGVPGPPMPAQMHGMPPGSGAPAAGAMPPPPPNAAGMPPPPAAGMPPATAANIYLLRCRALLSPPNPQPHRALREADKAVQYAATGDKGQALKNVLSEAFHLRGAALVRCNAHGEALRCYHVGLRMIPNDPQLLNDRLQLTQSMWRLDESRNRLTPPPTAMPAPAHTTTASAHPPQGAPPPGGMPPQPTHFAQGVPPPMHSGA